MKLKTLVENMNGNGTKTPEQVLTAAFAVVAVRGGYVNATMPQSTKEDVLCALWGIGARPNDPSVSFIHGKMREPAVQNRALQALNWIRTLQVDKSSNAANFLLNAQSIAIKSDLGPKQIGFLVGLVPFFERQAGKLTKTGGVVERSWPALWGQVKMLWKQPAVVVDTRQINTAQGASFQAVDLSMNDKYEFTWFLSDGASLPRKGQKLDVTGYLERHPKMGTIKFVPDRKWAKKTKKELNIGEESGSKSDDDEIKD